MSQQNQNFEVPQELGRILKYSKEIIIGVVILLTIGSGVFQVGTEEVGVITTFGKYSRTIEPGLGFKIPFVEKVYKVPVERQQKLEFGFRTTRAGIDSQYSRKGNSRDESLMLTGDLNLADVEWVVQFRVKSAKDYLFNVRDPENTLRNISEAAMRQIVGDRTVNEVLTIGRAQITQEVESLIQEISDEYTMGVKIEQVVLQDINPPESVKAAFNAVNEAQQEKETLINKANSEYNKVIPKAAGEAQATIQQAEGFAVERVNNAKGDVARFNALYTEYIKAPEVTKKRIYLETMSKILPEIGQVVVTDKEGNNVLPLLQMGAQTATRK